MGDIAVVIIDAHQSDLTTTSISNMNDIINRSEALNESLFYVIPYGDDLHPDVNRRADSSILRYDPDKGDPYRQTRMDEKITGRSTEKVQLYSPHSKAGDFADKERDRERSAYAGPPGHSNAPSWASPMNE